MNYDLWHALLAGSELGRDVFNDGNTIGLGFWRTKDLKPVATWVDEDGELVMTLGNNFVGPDQQLPLWSQVLNRPVTEWAYRKAMDTGEWDDVDNTVVDFAKALKAATTSDEISKLVEKMAASASQYRNLDNDTASAACQSLRSSLLEAKRKADETREEEKKPHLAECRRVDGLWRPIITAAETAANTARSYITRWETLKRESAIAAKKRLDEEVAAAAAAAAKAGEPAPEPREPQLELNTPAPQATVKGGAGRAASVRTKMVVFAIDPEVVFKRYSSNPEVIDLLKKLAQRDIDAGIAVEGASTKEEVVVR